MFERSVVSIRRAAFAVALLPLLALVALAGGGGGTIAMPNVADSMGPLDVPGVTISNFGVVDGRIFRGEQPTQDEYRQLAALGVKTVIDLRLDRKPQSKEWAEAAGLHYINIPIDDRGEPSDEQAAAFLKAVQESSTEGRVYVHCAGGRHRTGSMIAVYRMTQDGWDIDKAFQEMKNYDFYTRNGHAGFKTYVFDYYQRMTSNPKSVPVAYCPVDKQAAAVAAAAASEQSVPQQ